MLDKSEYFTDDSVVKNETYNSLINFLRCPACLKIFNNPMLCQQCEKVYCKRCIENNENKCPSECSESNFIVCNSKNELLSNIQYTCNNCSEVVFKNNINDHLKLNCKHKPKFDKRLSEIFVTKKKLLKLSKDDIIVKKYSNTILNFTSKFKYIKYFFNNNSYNIRSF